MLNVVYSNSFKVTRLSLSHGWVVLQLKLGQLNIDVVDHHTQPRTIFNYHGHTDRSDISVDALRITNRALKQTQFL